jgi:cytochrome b subunit of formate dehydrogenase
VHQKVIRGELWEKAPNQVPVCVDCHAPHKARKVYYELGMADRNCLQCHSDPGLVSEKDPKRSMHVNAEAMKGGAHERVACAQCHNGVSAAEKRPCATQTMKVDCSTCHAKAVDAYKTGIHGKLSGRGDPQAPECRDCHGTHDIRKRTDTKSSTYPTGVPNLCGKCHREGEKAAVRYKGSQHEIVKHYQTSIHGKGLLQSGLVVTATCTDCHDSHKVLPGADPASTVNKNNIAATCAKCHNGIYEKFSESVHHPDERDRAKGKEYPVCSDCHSAHQISRTDYEGFKFEIMSQCGRCHQAVTKSYFDTFHGKVVKLGYTKTAKCYDCHGSHDIQGIFSPKSKLSRDNIVQTCGKCHPGSHRRFAGYLTHATHHDRVKYPILFYTFWAMSILLIGVFSVFGIHTMMWLPRSLKARKRHALRASEWSGTEKQVLRFSRLERQLHVLVIVSFLGLALTGMTLKFSYLGWAQVLSRLLGGFESAGVIHRICAVVTFFYFGAHLFELYRKRRRIGASWRDFLIGKLSMVPNMTDLKELVGTLKWFVGRGPKPAYGRWTYWEKFDYLAVFWGVAVIGSTGLVLWFPAFFTRFLPGWSINVATVVHSDEALLAAGFIFTVHFFNTHFRPEKFPMDPVIFTGRIPLEEFKEERPREYAELAASGELEKKLVDPLPGIVVRAMKMFGAAALFTGLFLVVLIIYAEVFGYK